MKKQEEKVIGQKYQREWFNPGDVFELHDEHGIIGIVTNKTYNDGMHFVHISPDKPSEHYYGPGAENNYTKDCDIPFKYLGRMADWLRKPLAEDEIDVRFKIMKGPGKKWGIGIPKDAHKDSLLYYDDAWKWCGALKGIVPDETLDPIKKKIIALRDKGEGFTCKLWGWYAGKRRVFRVVDIDPIELVTTFLGYDTRGYSTFKEMMSTHDFASRVMDETFTSIDTPESPAMTPEGMRRRIPEDTSLSLLLDLSIEKWKRYIAAKTLFPASEPNTGPMTCALCHNYNHQIRECAGCPLETKENVRCCEEYHAFVNAIEDLKISCAETMLKRLEDEREIVSSNPKIKIAKKKKWLP